MHAVTLTGDGERAHLRGRHRPGHACGRCRRPGRRRGAPPCVLVGHSYGGMVVTAAAEALLARAAGGVPCALAYVDAVPLAGDSWSSGHSLETAQRLVLAAAHDQALPPADPAIFGLEGADRDWLLRRQVPHPFGMYREPLQFRAERLAALPRLFVDCTAPALATIDASRGACAPSPAGASSRSRPGTARW
ncbi:MAG: alpha/beta fold hydrolase [Rubrivivax sp.]